MGEDFNLNSKLFELPADGEVVLPELEEVALEDIPESVIDQIQFEERTQVLSSTRALGKARVLDFGPAGNAYLLTYHAERDVGVFSRFYVVNEIDTTNSGEIMGAGISFLELSDNGQETDVPCVQYTFTKHEYERQGLALRRLIILNMANKMIFKRPLASGSFVDPGVEQLWQKLEAAGLATKIEEGYYLFK